MTAACKAESDCCVGANGSYHPMANRAPVNSAQADSKQERGAGCRGRARTYKKDSSLQQRWRSRNLVAVM